MKKIILFLFTCIFAGQFLSIPASANSEETNQCIDRISGLIYNYLSDYNISNDMENEIAIFCLKTNALAPYSDLNDLASLSRDLVEDFYAVSLVSTFEVYSLGQPLFDTNDFSITWKSEIEKSLEIYKSNIVSRRFALNDQYTDELIDEIPYLQNDLDNIQEAQLDFLNAYEIVQAALKNNSVCTEGYSENSECTCFDGYELDLTNNTCIETPIVITDEGEESEEIITNQNISAPKKDIIFEDIKTSDHNYNAILYLKDNGIINGYPDGTFKSSNMLNRAELLKILVEGKGLTPNSSQYANCFPDVGTEWHAKYICYAKEQGWIQGYADNTFRPVNNINKAEAIKMLLEVFKQDTSEPSSSPFTDVSIDAWYGKYISKANELGLLEETGTYSPASYITRGEISENIYRLLIQL